MVSLGGKSSGLAVGVSLRTFSIFRLGLHRFESWRGVDQQAGQSANHNQKRASENHHRVAEAELADQKGGQRCDIDGCQPEAGHHEAGNHAGLGSRKPLYGRRGGRGVPEAEAEAREDAETQNPVGQIGALGGDQQPGTGENSAENGRQPGVDLILQPAGSQHRQCKHQAAHGKGIVQGCDIPVEAAIAGENRLLDFLLENTPGVKDSQGQVDAQSGCHNAPAAVLGFLHLFLL